MTSRLSSVSLLEVEADLAGVLSEEELVAARLFLLPVAAVDQGGDVAWLLAEKSVFGAIVLEGLLVPAFQIGAVSTLRLIGPDSVVPPSQAQRPTPFTLITSVAWLAHVKPGG